MSRYLYAASVGPVQEFIKAARKTRDLWFGSTMLSEISRAVAVKLRDHELSTKLIFPSAASLVEDDGARTNVANVILCSVEVPHPVESEEGQKTLSDLAKTAKQAAEKAWLKYAENARKWIDRRTKDTSGEFKSEIWDEQITDVVEFYSAWTPHESDGDYKTARRRVMQLLEGRKRCRNFRAAPSNPGIPKSSLDGARESVFSDVDDETRGALRLRTGELLDAIGMTKRLAIGPGQKDSDARYPSVSRVAAESWLQGASKRPKGEGQTKNDLDLLCDECQSIKAIHRIPARLKNSTATFPYEGAVVFRNRHREFANETGNDRNFKTDTRKLCEALKRIEKGLGEPDPYVAVLLADGDRVGNLLKKLSSENAHESFSKELSTYAARVQEIIESEFNGVLIYSGGDDVLAMLPVYQAVQCARKLHTAFEETMTRALSGSKDVGPDAHPTLSVGIAIGHFMEPLEFLLDFARTAEHDAKEDTAVSDDSLKQRRNSLAVHVYSRGGAPVTHRERWDVKRASLTLDERLSHWVNLLVSDQLPHRAAYELRSLADDFDNWDDDEKLAIGIRKEAQRVLKRKKTSAGDEETDELLGERVGIAELLADVRSAADLRHVASELLIARRIFMDQRLTEPRSGKTRQGVEA